MNINRRLENATWDDEKLEGERLDRFLNGVLAREACVSEFEHRQALTTHSEILAYLATGKTLSFDTDWYALIRDTDAIKQKISHTVEPQILCGCGHQTSKELVMSTSTGTSCPDCYDRMSE